MASKKNLEFPVFRITLGILFIFICSSASLPAQSTSHGSNSSGGWPAASSDQSFPVKGISENGRSVPAPQARNEKDPTSQFLVGDVIVEQGSLKDYFSRQNNR